MVRRLILAVGLSVLTGGCATTQMRTGSAEHWVLEETALDRPAHELDNSIARHLAWAENYRRQVAAVPGQRTVANTLVPYNDLLMHVEAVRSECELFANVHPDLMVVEVAERGEQRVKKYVTDLLLDREMYDALSSCDLSGADEATKYFVAKQLRDMRRAGVELSETVGARVRALNAELVEIGQQFAKNIKTSVGEIAVDSPADLDGLPQDWIDKHPPAEDGKIHITTQYPDYYPFVTYARNADARLALFRAFKNRGYPENIPVLQSMLTKRHELANLLGYDHWADYATEDKMIESAVATQSFLDRIAQAGRAAAERDYQQLLQRKRRDAPAATKVAEWERGYYANLVRSESYSFDAQAVRPYFNYPDVQAGVLKLTGGLFGVRYQQVQGLKLWHQDVTAWDIFDGNRRLGRFYLDMHPRANKYSHAACFGYREGIAGIRLPQAVLVCNFPNPADSADGLALMEHDDVVTFLHEFGHLLHAIFAGHRRWLGNSGIKTEWDFVEAPSQMLEEWCYSVEPLQMFAKHHETGEPIPAELVNNLRRAADFGKGIDNAHQTFYSAVSLNYYNRDPQSIDTTELLVALQDKYSPFDYVDGTHFQCSFGHLDGYSAIYYTYRWSLVISKALLSRFEEGGMLNKKIAAQYREKILEPGGSKPAAELVADFLGKPYSFEPFERWLNRS